MAIQDSDSLVMTALSILGDPHPNPNQPILGDGVHLEWIPGANRGFPLKGGYYVFRRRVGGPATLTCIRSFLTKTPILDIITKPQLQTPVGTISTPSGGPLPVVPFEPDPQNDKAFLLGTIPVLQLILPPGTVAEGLQVKFRMRLAAGSEPGTVIVNGFLQGQPVFARRAMGVNQDDIVLSVDTGRFDRLDFPQAPALLYDVCTSISQPNKPTCLMPLLKDSDPATVAAQRSLTTAMGTLLEANGPHLNPLPAATGTTGIVGFSIRSLHFSLPTGKTASQFTVTLRFPDPAASAATAPSAMPASFAAAGPLDQQVQVVASLGTTVVFTRSVTAPSPNQDVTVAADLAAFDNILISSGSGVSAVLLDLCCVPAPVVVMLSRPANTLTSTTAQQNAPGLPGQGWELLPNLSSVIKLPLFHPLYSASPGPESINASMAIAKARFHYGAWADSFNGATPTPGNGTVTLTNGSPIATGSGTNWTTSLVGSMICLPLTGGDYTAYAVMAVLAPDSAVLSRSYSGPNQSNATYQLVVGDDFAELHDRVASLLQSPNDMRAAIVPPPLDKGTLAGGKFLVASAGALVNGIGTQWTTSLTGCCIEIGPAWYLSTCLAGSSVYRIQAVNSASQIVLDRPFAGLPYFVPSAKCDYRIFARAVGDDPNANTPSFDFKPMDLLELASLVPGYAQALGLYWIDTAVQRGDVFDYIVIADHENRFSQQVDNALSWLNGAPDFTGNSVDGFVKLGVQHLGSPPLAAPTQLEIFRLPTGGSRISIAQPDRADSDVGVSVLNAADWADPNAPQPALVMLNLWRLPRGTDETKLAPVGNDATGYDDLGKLLPSSRDPAKVPNPPAGWPTDTIHFVDSGPDHTGLDVGWYSYRAYAIDPFGRFSPDSSPIPWKDIDNSPATVADAVHLADTTPPPPPAGVLAWCLDDRDPYMLRDASFIEWRSQFPGATDWANWQPGTPFPATLPVFGLRLKFRWPWSHQNQGPDLREFRVYALENPLNARIGRVISVTPVSGQPTQSLATLKLDAADSTAINDYVGASLQAGNRAFPISASQSGGTVQLTVLNGGPLNTVPPDSNIDGAIVIPADHELAKELLNPKNWDKWLAAIPEDLAGTQYDVELVEDSSAILYDDDLNKFIGAQATWNGSAFVLDAIPSGYDLDTVRPGIDVLSLASDTPPGYFVVGIQSVNVNGMQIVPVQVPDPTSDGTTKYKWRIGPANRGVQGIAGQWTPLSRQLSLDGSPDLSNVNLGSDLIYLAAPGATPANLNCFFAIEALDDVSHTITLKDNGHLTALQSGSWPWKIGRPVRHYEVFLPKHTSGVLVGSTDASTLLMPSQDQPVRHGTIGVSSADKRDEVADQYWRSHTPARNRKGNESWLSGPAPLFRVLRDPVDAPTYTWNVTRLYATRANYKDESYFTVRWNKPKGPHYAHVFRAMDSSLFLAHWKLKSSVSTTGVPPDISALISTFLATFDARKTNSEYSDAAKLYDQLDDMTLWWLAARPELADAYMQVTIKPLDLSDPANADRLGPDDALPFTANSAVCAYTATLPGKSQNRYFFRVMFLDGAQNRSSLGGPTPTVYLPNVMPAKKPVIAKVVGGDRAITVQWVPCRDPSVTDYRIYRTTDLSLAADIRSMQLVATITIPSTNPAAVSQWQDLAPPLQTSVYYRIVATDTYANPSLPSSPTSGRAFDDSFPEPPVWKHPALQAGGTTLLLSWQAAPGVRYRVERRVSSSDPWAPITGWLKPGVADYSDSGRARLTAYDYQLKAVDARGIYSKTFLLLRA